MMRSDPAGLLEHTFGGGGRIAMAEAPGRVNIIGEHTDYNDGLVLPFATRESTSVAVRATRTRVVRAVSASLGDPVVRPWPDDPAERKGRCWSDPVLAMIWALRDVLPDNRGLDLGITSTVPVGGGLSSSSALEIATAVALETLFDLDLDDLEMVHLCQMAETAFVGVESGIMDPYAILLSQEGAALFLDVRALHHQRVPAILPGMNWVIVDSRLPRNLATSGYNERRRECRETVARIQAVSDFEFVRSLRDLRLRDVEALRGSLPGALHDRVRHVVEENDRVCEMRDALLEEDAPRSRRSADRVTRLAARPLPDKSPRDRLLGRSGASNRAPWERASWEEDSEASHCIWCRSKVLWSSAHASSRATPAKLDAAPRSFPSFRVPEHDNGLGEPPADG